MTSSTKVFSKEGLEDIMSAVNQMTSIGVMVCPPYTFVVGNFQGELFIIDTHVIRSQLVGNGNGIVITFSKIEHFTQWLLRRLGSSGVKMDDMYDIYISSFFRQKSFYIVRR